MESGWKQMMELHQRQLTSHNSSEPKQWQSHKYNPAANGLPWPGTKQTQSMEVQNIEKYDWLVEVQLPEE